MIPANAGQKCEPFPSDRKKMGTLVLKYSVADCFLMIFWDINFRLGAECGHLA